MTNIDAIKRALSPAPAPAPVPITIPKVTPMPLRPPQYLKARQAAQTLYWGMKLFGRPEVPQGNLRGDTISWRIQRNGWATAR